MNLNTELIVLYATKTGEKSLVVHCLSSLWGRRSFICSVGKTFSLANFQALSLLEATVSTNPHSNLWRLKEVKAISPLNSLRTNAIKSSIALFISEVLYRCIREDSSDIFQWCKKCVLTLEGLEDDYSNFHLRFLLELVSVMGFSPNSISLAPFAENNLQEINKLLNSDLATCLTLPLSGKKRSEIADSLLRYLSFHIESTITIRSLEVLKTLF